jgi:hypothetical protein
MRILLVVAAMLLVGCAGSSIRMSYEPNEQHHEYTIDHGLTKDEAFKRAMNWVAVNYVSANDVIQLKDKETGVIVVKAVAPFVVITSTRYVNYTMQIKVKDNKSKITFDLAGLTGGGGFYEQPNYAPPRDAMPSIIGGFVTTKNALTSAWTSATAADDF